MQASHGSLVAKGDNSGGGVSLATYAEGFRHDVDFALTAQRAHGRNSFTDL